VEKKDGITKIEELTKQIEAETDFNKTVELFAEAATMVKQTLSEASEAKGKLLEIIRDLDTYIEKELKVGAEDSDA